MGRSKHIQYTKEELNGARIGRAIAASARVVILHEINKYHIITNKYIAQRVSLSESAVSQHLQILRETGFIESKYLGDGDGFHGYAFTKQGEADFSKLQEIL
jgi:predicted ArsR family transcriptional regulator